MSCVQESTLYSFFGKKEACLEMDYPEKKYLRTDKLITSETWSKHLPRDVKVRFV